MEKTLLPGDSDTFLALVSERFAGANRIARSEQNMADFIFANAFSVNAFALEIAAPELETNWQGTLETLDWDIGKMDEIADMGIPGVNSVRKTSRRWQMKLFARGAMMSTRLAKDLADNPMFAKHLANHITGLMASLNTSMKSAILGVIMESAMKISDFAELAFPHETPSFVNLMNRWNSRMGALNKGDKSLIALVNETSTMMIANSGTFNSLVICPEMANLTALSSYFGDASKVGQNVANDVVFNSGATAYGRFSSVQKVYTAGIYWRPRNEGEARNPMTTQRELGLFYVMADRMPINVPYTPSQRDIGVFDPTANNFRRISFMDGVRYAANWKSDGTWNSELIDGSNFDDWYDWERKTYAKYIAKMTGGTAPPGYVVPNYPGGTVPPSYVVPNYPGGGTYPGGETPFKPGSPPPEYVEPEAEPRFGPIPNLFDDLPSLTTELGNYLSELYSNASVEDISNNPVVRRAFPSPQIPENERTLFFGALKSLFGIDNGSAAAASKRNFARYAFSKNVGYLADLKLSDYILPSAGGTEEEIKAIVEGDANFAADESPASSLLKQALSNTPAYGQNAGAFLKRIIPTTVQSNANAFFKSGSFSKSQALIGGIISEIDPYFGQAELHKIFSSKFDDKSRLLQSIKSVRQLRDKNHADIVEIATHDELQRKTFQLPLPVTPALKPSKSRSTGINLGDTLLRTTMRSPPFKVIIFQPRIRYEGNALVFLQNAGGAVHLKYGKLLATWGLESQAQQNDIAISIPLAAMVTNPRNLCVYPAAQFRRVMIEESLKFVTNKEFDNLRGPSGYRDLKTHQLISVIVPDNEEIPPHIALAPFNQIQQLNNIQFESVQPEWIQRLYKFLRMEEQYPSESGVELNYICSRATHLVADKHGFLTQITEGLDPFGNLLTYAGANDARECGISNSAAALSGLQPVADDY